MVNLTDKAKESECKVRTFYSGFSFDVDENDRRLGAFKIGDFDSFQGKIQQDVFTGRAYRLQIKLHFETSHSALFFSHVSLVKESAEGSPASSTLGDEDDVNMAIHFIEITLSRNPSEDQNSALFAVRKMVSFSAIFPSEVLRDCSELERSGDPQLRASEWTPVFMYAPRNGQNDVEYYGQCLNEWNLVLNRESASDPDHVRRPIKA